jgi:peptide-methionine (R)-S-oxide reductase
MTSQEYKEKSDDYWKEQLNEEEYKVLREKGTERAGTGEYIDNKEEGIYKCAGCGKPLFSSEHKFNSGSGWPSFYKPIDEKNVDEETDRSHGMKRTEILCSDCGGHLGHVFNDGPKPTGQRYCINSISLDFEKKEE